MSESDWRWMGRALELAEKGRGYVEPNPLVGAVLVREGSVVGEGWHQRFGEAHAEVNALNAAGELARGATLYVTLEPCCHLGKTPPCTEAIMRAGISRVVTALADPFPQVSGQGIRQLAEVGIEVDVGLGELEARRLNAPYFKLVTTGRPYVHAKWAMTLDGKICTRSGDSQWITGEAARQLVHSLRGRMDAIVVGIGTVLADNPRLTVRRPGPRTPVRIVLDSQGRTPETSRLVETAEEAPLMIVTGQDVSSAGQAKFAKNIEVLSLPAEHGQTSVQALLQELGRRRMTNILVEGGSAVLGSFFDAQALDEVHVFIAPRLAGGTLGKSPIGGLGIDTIAETLNLTECQVEQMGQDFLVHGTVKREGQQSKIG
jgi:diaminohydroxyphosphoribosylaminopyrimidine deaminase/5-amino-6-(5-phosphoribosylamino)uracil reductase